MYDNRPVSSTNMSLTAVVAVRVKSYRAEASILVILFLPNCISNCNHLIIILFHITVTCF